MMPHQDSPRIRISAQFVLGLTIAAAGVLFTLDNLGVLRAGEYIRYWPVVLVAVGILQMAQARAAAGVVAGGILIFVGSVMLGNSLGLLRMNVWDFWPLFLVIVGGRIVRQAFSRDVRAPRGVDAGVDAGSMTSAIAVMSGFSRTIASQAFKGGELTAFMGGGKLDLRGATLAGGQAVVSVFAVMGGFEIFVPETWNVMIEVTPFMGGVDIKARTSTDLSAPRLVVRGFVMMGGVDIKN
jgi:predicted membrane protein